MRAAVIYDIDDIRIEERPIPPIGGGEMLVRTAASGICTGDVMPWYIRRKAPLVFGHEIAGTVCALGDPPPSDDGGVPFAIGDRVFVHHHAPCFACRACERGDFVQCATWRASKIDPGGMAEYVRVPAENVRDTLRLPDTVDFANASMVEPLACVVKSMRRARLRDGDVIYVISCGVMGLLHVSLARALGHRVIASDFVEERRAIARELGAETIAAGADATAIVRSITGERGGDVVVCLPGSIAALEHAVDAVAPGGTVVMFTPLEPGERFPFDQSAAYFRDLTFVSSYSCGPEDTRAALAHLARGTVSARALHADERTLDGVQTAYAALAAGRAVKPIVRFGGGAEGPWGLFPPADEVRERT